MASKETTRQNVLRDGVSVVIPAYNAEDWIAKTTKKVAIALDKASIEKAEIIIVDDGSSDNTEAVSRSIKLQVPVRVFTQENKGRFLARKTGVEHAQYPTLFFVDTRVWIDEDALSYVVKQQADDPGRLVWNGDVKVFKKGNIIARFGDAVTRIGWRRYHGNPRLLSYGVEDFDYYPKGTGIFIAPKDLLKNAIAWFESQTKDIRNSSDDTLLIRFIAERQNIWISPGFSSTYFARTTLKAFIGHSYHRGLFFVDGFLRPGTRFYYPLIFFLLLSIIALAAMVVFPVLIIPFAALMTALWLTELFVSLYLKIGLRDSVSLFLLSPVFALSYGLGIWRASIKRFTKI